MDDSTTTLGELNIGGDVNYFHENIDAGDGLEKIENPDNTVTLEVDNTVVRNNSDGNQTINGPVTFPDTVTIAHLINSDSFTTTDPTIETAKNNPSDLLDAGVYSEYKDGANTRYAGLIRRHNSDNFYCFHNQINQPITQLNLGTQDLGTLICRNPVENQEVSTKKFCDDTYLKLSGGQLSGEINMSNNRLRGIGGPPVFGNEATTRDYVLGLNSAKVSKAGDTMSGSLNMNGNTIAGLAEPVQNDQSATKLYVDTHPAIIDLENLEQIRIKYNSTYQIRQLSSTGAYFDTKAEPISGQNSLSIIPNNSSTPIRYYFYDNGGADYILRMTKALSTFRSDLDLEDNVLKFSPTTGQKINLYSNSDNYAIGVEPQTTYITTARNFIVYKGPPTDVIIQLQTDQYNNVTIPNGNLSMNSNQIKNLGEPTDDADSTTKIWVQDYVENHPGNVDLQDLTDIQFKNQLGSKIRFLGAGEANSIGTKNNEVYMACQNQFKLYLGDPALNNVVLQTNASSNVVVPNGDLYLEGNQVKSVGDPNLDYDAVNLRFLRGAMTASFQSSGVPAPLPVPYPSPDFFYALRVWDSNKVLKVGSNYLLEVNTNIRSMNHASTDNIGFRIQYTINGDVFNSYKTYVRCSASARLTNETFTQALISERINANQAMTVNNVKLQIDSGGANGIQIASYNITFKLTETLN